MDSFEIGGIRLRQFFGNNASHNSQSADNGRFDSQSGVVINAFQAVGRGTSGARAHPYAMGGQRGRGGSRGRGRGRGTAQSAISRLQERLDAMDANRISFNMPSFDGGISDDNDNDNDNDDGETMQMAPQGPPVPRQIERLMHPPLTGEDEQYQVNNDSYGYRWKPVPHPKRKRELDAANQSDLVKECFMCNLESGTLEFTSVAIEGDEVTKLSNYIISKRGILQPEYLAHEVHDRFQRYIRRPANSRLREGQVPIPEWSIESILDHLGGHKAVSKNLLDSMMDIQSIIMYYAADHGMLQLPITHPSDQPYSVSDCRMNFHYTKIVNDSMKLLKELFIMKKKLEASEGGNKTSGGGGDVVSSASNGRVTQTFFDKHPPRQLY